MTLRCGACRGQRPPALALVSAENGEADMGSLCRIDRLPQRPPNKGSRARVTREPPVRDIETGRVTPDLSVLRCRRCGHHPALGIKGLKRRLDGAVGAGETDIYV